MSRTLWILLTCCLGSALMAAPAGAPKPAATPTPAKARVVQIGSDYDNYRHNTDYDNLQTNLGWTLEKVDNTAFAAFTPKLANYDIILGRALFNYSHPQNLLEKRAAILGWLRAGGAMVLTDCNYADHTEFLKNLGAGYEATAKNCKGDGTTKGVEADHDLLSWPNVWKPRAVWAHMELGAKWHVLARCSEGNPELAIAEFGRGFILLSSAQPLTNDEMVNIWHYLQMRRVGLTKLAVDGWNNVVPGTCLAKFRLATERTQPATIMWKVYEPDGKTLEAKTTARTRTTLRMKPGQRGAYKTWVEVTPQGEKTYVGPVHEFTVPDLLDAELIEPLYRNDVLLGSRPTTVRVKLTAWPFNSQDKSAVARLQLLQGGKVVSKQDQTVPLVGGATAVVQLPATGLQPGACQALVTILIGGKAQSQRTFDLQALPERNAQVVFDSHLGARVDGKDFFPIGAYHVPDNQLDRAKAMGFNCVQMWGGAPDQCKHSLDLAGAQGLKVLLEMSNLLHDSYQPDTLRASVRAHRDHPALFAWYTVDEPYGPKFNWCTDAYQLCQKEDPNHPTYLVSCEPTLFNMFAPAVDILAIDPYPVGRVGLNQVALWSRTVEKAVNGKQPWILVPQAFNWDGYKDVTKGRAPSPDEEWAMIATGLIHGAKGIVYYAWEDGTVGIVHEPTLQAEIPKINALLASVGSELVGSERLMISPTDSDDIQAAVFGGTRRLLVAANVGAVPASVVVPKAGSLKSLRAGVAAPALVGGKLTLAPSQTVVAEIVP